MGIKKYFFFWFVGLPGILTASGCTTVQNEKAVNETSVTERRIKAAIKQHSAQDRFYIPYSIGTEKKSALVREAHYGIKNGQMLKKAVAEWVEQSDFKSVVWELDPQGKDDLAFGVAANFGSDFERAMDALMRALSNGTKTRLSVDFYRGNNVVVISGKIQ